MKTMLLLAALACALVTAAAPPVLAESDGLFEIDPLRGTWSGRWTSDSGTRPVTVRFSYEDESIVGEMLNPTALTFDTISFDRDALRLVAEGVDLDEGQLRVEATIQEDTRLNGTLTLDGLTGEMKLVKWTYRP